MNTSLELPSNKKFGFLFAFIFLLLAIWALWKSNFPLSLVFISVSVSFFLLALIYPEKLIKLNRLWFQLGLLLAKIFNPLILGVIFFFLITPVALVTKLFGRDELGIRSKKNKLSDTYWKSREPLGPDSKSFKNQY
jgi:hypothetical protein